MAHFHVSTVDLDIVLTEKKRPENTLIQVLCIRVIIITDHDVFEFGDT
jgi:hypothetical protein